jgi:hypothetical protein
VVLIDQLAVQIRAMLGFYKIKRDACNQAPRTSDCRNSQAITVRTQATRQYSPIQKLIGLVGATKTRTSLRVAFGSKQTTLPTPSYRIAKESAWAERPMLRYRCDVVVFKQHMPYQLLPMQRHRGGRRFSAEFLA